jgi:signal transduction histidine kinase
MPLEARSRLGSLGRAAAALWRGPDGLPPRLRLEWRFVVVRWIGILLIAPIFWVVDLEAGTRIGAYAVVAFAAAFNFAVQRAIRRGLGLDRFGVLTAIGDGFLNVAMLVVLGGGFGSPFSFFLFVNVLSIAMRFGYGPSLATAGLFIAVNAFMDLATATPIDLAFFFRSAFLLVSALMASYLVEQGRRDQAALRASNDELRRAYADLAAAHQDLLKIDEMKSCFIANVSHELRTPLTSVLAYSELLLTYDDPPPETRREFLEIIHGESERLTRLINEVLDISKIESGALELRRDPIELRSLIASSARSHREAIRQRGLAFELDVPERLPLVVGDADRLQQVVANLLSNAMKFTPAGAIRLSAWGEGESVLIAVSDTGVGIAPEDQARIFEKFHQVGDIMTAKPSGTGLGLAICRELVGAHGGRIWVESRPGAGSTFLVALPAASVAAAAAEPVLVGAG